MAKYPHEIYWKGSHDGWWLRIEPTGRVGWGRLGKEFPPPTLGELSAQEFLAGGHDEELRNRFPSELLADAAEYALEKLAALACGCLSPYFNRAVLEEISRFGTDNKRDGVSWDTVTYRCRRCGQQYTETENMNAYGV